ncbi:hypothetical protein V1507DRAFT_468020 [Lipomyces tetrasporus]
MKFSAMTMLRISSCTSFTPFCNFHLMVGRVLHASGAAEVIDMIFRDDDQFNGGNVEGDYC